MKLKLLSKIDNIEIASMGTSSKFIVSPRLYCDLATMEVTPKLVPQRGIFNPDSLPSQFRHSTEGPITPCIAQRMGWKRPRLNKLPQLLPAAKYDNDDEDEDRWEVDARRIRRIPVFEQRPRTPQERVFDIDILLIQIMENLSPSDLKSCRSVNHHWNSTATKILLKKDALQISSYYFRNEEFLEYSVRVRHSDGWKDHNLDDLTTLINDSWNFPCASFRFFDGNLVTPCLIQFFQQHGSIIKNLLLDIYFCRGDPSRQVLCDYPRMDALDRLLSELTTELETLTLINFPDVGYLEAAVLFTPVLVHLPKLRFLELEDDEFLPYGVYKDMIDAAINLQHITIESKKHILYLLEIKRVHTIYGISFRSSEEYLRLYDLLMGSYTSDPLRLQKLVLRLGKLSSQDALWAHLGSTLCRLLNHNVDTLQAIQWQPTGMISGFASLNPLTKVTHMGIADIPGDHAAIFPPDLDVVKAFPNLQSVCMELTSLSKGGELADGDGEDYIEPMFEDYWTTGPIPSVKQLVVTSANMIPAVWIEKLAVLFPNLERLKLFGVNRAEHIKAAWSFAKLETVEIRAEINCDGEIDPFTIDEGITSLDATQCQEVLSMSDDVPVQYFVDIERSVLNCRGLRKLNIIIEDKHPFVVESPIPNLMTKVSKNFLVAFAPGVKVRVELMAEALANIEGRLRRTVHPSFLRF